jgi:hypothetical protein
MDAIIAVDQVPVDGADPCAAAGAAVRTVGAVRTTVAVRTASAVARAGRIRAGRLGIFIDEPSYRFVPFAGVDRVRGGKSSIDA